MRRQAVELGICKHLCVCVHMCLYALVFFLGLDAYVSLLPPPPPPRTDNTLELLCVEIRLLLVAVLKWKNSVMMVQKCGIGTLILS